MAGGMTFSEVREAYDLSSSVGKDVYIGIITSSSTETNADVTTGSTHTFTPRQFIDDLKVLDLGGVGSKAIPGGTEKSRVFKSFQDYYDDKYFIRAPQPQRPALNALPPPHEERGKPPRPSPGPSFAGSTASMSSSVKEAKKKKNKFFPF
jgi:syntaxin-binding protein 1